MSYAAPGVQMVPIVPGGTDLAVTRVKAAIERGDIDAETLVSEVTNAYADHCDAFFAKSGIRPEGGRFVQQFVTHTHTAPSGTIVVVRNVPAEIYEDPSGREEIAYRIDVSEKLENLVDSALAATPEKTVAVLSYDDRPSIQPGEAKAHLNQPSVIETSSRADRAEIELRDLVKEFSAAVFTKLVASEQKYGWQGRWKSDDWQDELRRLLREHVEKGDPRDAAAYCAFAWYHGWSLAESAPEIEADGDDRCADCGFTRAGHGPGFAESAHFKLSASCSSAMLLYEGKE